ncbi:AraC family transcriptional regulator ligand-binding domain-containing protein [Marinobacter salinisoli]|uniref:AraC family transcriptional regulator ligand-binding domain-containing protein n=1 Tax=Marinobacter salinisoli TaxID=2769486 RepID=A0ABX7MRK7_9GAMM|nr:AraC family transcriptional regulator [Marinobacter salinisoli]QSP94759.1 AraC family transcriptional regulator ligand-binding domain-containing protein [Marinobacter salinisoli]
MTSNAPHIATAARYIHILCQQLTTDQLTTEALLAGTGLRQDELLTPDGWIDHQTLDQFLANVENLADEPLPGVRLGHHLNVSAHGAAGYAGLTAGNAGQAIEVAIRFFPLITSLAWLGLEHRGERSDLRITPAPGISERTERFVVHTLLASFDVMGSFLVGNLDLRASLAFAEDPALSERLGAAIDNIAFNQPEHRLSLPREKLEIPFALADQAAHSRALAQCNAELEQLARHQGLAGKVMERLQHCGQRLLNQDAIAADLGMSSRTLHRRLLKDGTSFRELLLREKMDRARHYLTHDQLSVTETAYRLGYQDSANFTRAFRQATGLTPTQYAKSGQPGTEPSAPERRPGTGQRARESSPRNT